MVMVLVPCLATRADRRSSHASATHIRSASFGRASGANSLERRHRNMEFLRDRIIETGICKGMDLGRNFKRGTPVISHDFIVWKNGRSKGVGVDIASGYDDVEQHVEADVAGVWSGSGLRPPVLLPVSACGLLGGEPVGAKGQGVRGKGQTIFPLPLAPYLFRLYRFASRVRILPSPVTFAVGSQPFGTD